VAEGDTNRQVAARLVISEKTVARHLANVYRKLDVSTRTGAAAWARRNGLQRPTA
jgi:DNA-binding NarL/FixJ family response regulator